MERRKEENKGHGKVKWKSRIKKMSPVYSSSYAPAPGFSHTKQSFFKAQSSMDCHIEIDEEENASDQISVSTFYGQNGNGGAKRRKMTGVP